MALYVAFANSPFLSSEIVKSRALNIAHLLRIITVLSGFNSVSK